MDYRHSEHDLRAKQIHVTQKALQIQDSLIEQFCEFETLKFHGITEEDYHKVHQVLERIRNNLTQIMKEHEDA